MMETATKARPFVKWAGGKQALATEIVGLFPAISRTYYEPFLGGGSVFFTLGPKKAVLSDANDWLIETYKEIRDDPSSVASALDGMTNNLEEFLRIRAIDLETLRSNTRAAHFIYLNKTCFRGLFRVNRKGQFNVPYGKYQRRYYDLQELRAAASSLRHAEINAADFETTVATAQSGDFVYFDPPYYKFGGYSDFNRYTPGQFRESDHARLADVCRVLDKRGVRWAVSNSDTSFVHNLFEGYKFTRIQARREINLDPSKRKISELLVTNY